MTKHLRRLSNLFLFLPQVQMIRVNDTVRIVDSQWANCMNLSVLGVNNKSRSKY